MYTKDQMPWIDFLMINETTGQVVLKPDTPIDIKEKYEQFSCEKDKDGKVFK